MVGSLDRKDGREILRAEARLSLCWRIEKRHDEALKNGMLELMSLDE